MSVYTVGDERHYDANLIKYGEKFEKLGRESNYLGGFAIDNIEDAKKFIKEQEKEGVWAIYELDADWDKDTDQVEGEWFRRLINQSRILKKVKD